MPIMQNSCTYQTVAVSHQAYQINVPHFSTETIPTGTRIIFKFQELLPEDNLAAARSCDTRFDISSHFLDAFFLSFSFLRIIFPSPMYLFP